MGLVIGVDVGGTFTDVVVYDEESSELSVLKTPSSPPEFVEGFVSGVKGALAHWPNKSVSDIKRIAHGATIATNAILTQSGARVGLMMTEGFRDTLFIGIGWRPKMYDLFNDPVEPLFLAKRSRAVEVCERLDSDGVVVKALEMDSVRSAARVLVEEEKVDVIVICFLHAYANPSHEQMAREVIQCEYPDIHVSISSEVLPRPREYHRLVATAFDGYVKPVMNRYIRDLVQRLSSIGCVPRLEIMQSNGGVSGADAVAEQPVRTVLSGLAAGVLGAARVAANAGHTNCVSLDMGGTSADVALIVDGNPVITARGAFEEWPLHRPMVEVRTIGAGGSSIAWIDDAGGIRVGPKSAGAVPGPACYGRGGEHPTVTDASFVLGYLNPLTFAGGLELNIDQSVEAIDRKIARPLGIDVQKAALGIHSIVNTNMAQTLRLVSIKRGHDPRELTLVPLGGAGPVHGGRVAAEIGIKTMLVPPVPGVLSALGLLCAPTQHDAMVSFRNATRAVSINDIKRSFEEIDMVCRDRMLRDGVSEDDVQIEYLAEMRYSGQTHELAIQIERPLGTESISAAVSRFHATHKKSYNYSSPSKETEITMLRTVHKALPAHHDAFINAKPHSASVTDMAKPSGSRLARFDLERGFQDTPVWTRASLPAGFSLVGPAIVEQSDTTIVIYPEQGCETDSHGNLLIQIQ